MTQTTQNNSNTSVEVADLKFTYLKKLLRETAEALKTVMIEMANSIILEYNGEKTIQEICKIINTHITHVRTYL